MKKVFRDTLPVLVGYLFLGFGFGILLVERAHHNAIWAFFMSLAVYAGSGQYVAVDLMAQGATLINSFIAILLVNARHLFYGISLLGTYKNAGKKKPYMIFALTDETYSLVSQAQPPEGMSESRYCFLVSLCDHIYWIAGCVLGALAGQLPINYSGVEFVMTALFVTLFTEQWCSQKDHRPALIGVLSTTVCLVVCRLIGLKDYFLISSMAVIAIALVVMRKTGKEAAQDAA